MKIVLDTNIWLSGIFWKGSSYRIIKLAEEEKIEVLITKEILGEIITVLNREEKFQKFILDRRLAIKEIVKTVLTIANLIETHSKIKFIKEDPDDDKILEAAVDGKAEYIVFEDRHLLDINQFDKIKIVKAREFLERL